MGEVIAEVGAGRSSFHPGRRRFLFPEMQKNSASFIRWMTSSALMVEPLLACRNRSRHGSGFARLYVAFLCRFDGRT
jgi:hypothetical protein